MTLRTAGRSVLAMIVLGVLVCLSLLLALVLYDAAFAYNGHGPAMHTATILLFCCAAAGLLAAASAITAALLLPKRTSADQLS
jgi:hypothetical protein